MNQIIDQTKSVYRALRTKAALLRCGGIRTSRIGWRYMTGSLFPEHSDENHLEATMRWLCLSQDACGGKGCSAVYYFKTGWGVAYPETSGYIIGTYLAYADYSGDQSYIDRAIQLGDWEIDIQTPGGGVLSSQLVSYTRVFNTGQVILGWCALFARTGNKNYLDAALRAGDYILRMQDPDGAWRQDTYCGARTHHARVDWALLRLETLSGMPQYADAAVRNLRWILAQQRDNGSFMNLGWNGDRPITHVIDYTLRGLLECHLENSRTLIDLDLLPRIIKAANALCGAIETHPLRGIRGMVPSAFDENWESSDRHSCLTGNAQLAGFLIRLAETTGTQSYRETALTVIKAVKRTQDVTTSFLPIRGGVPGTYPMYHGYIADGFPNWAAKFLADALMMKAKFKQRINIPS